ncbi:hypothetical protein HN512_04320 [Candidatus Peregrinibacteria bacterium]|nr:hypothetical protein [Candidatus Peregrinibacteria bacterium]MBT3599034.1 hypothetical protein [Candidatus Peregrinibacteria bacterium]MBT4367382.1 hypothetical protein [Candidatus Peregrinibacteria bacterium]MBT6730660.1 hypothetical protein [Candidatus Peregrinibacteria bacterium]MBT7009161.1 hypothetical protein [Candidatus Peregrinibacteria bacterium]
MRNFLQNLSLRTSTAIVTFGYAIQAKADIFGDIPDIGGADSADVRTSITDILKEILTYMALVAVIFIVIAGIRLVVSQGEDAEKDKAKKTITYVIIGLIVILFARAIVSIVANLV